MSCVASLENWVFFRMFPVISILLLEVKLPYEPSYPSVGLLVCHNFKFHFHCVYRSTCFPFEGQSVQTMSKRRTFMYVFEYCKCKARISCLDGKIGAPQLLQPLAPTINGNDRKHSWRTWKTRDGRDERTCNCWIMLATNRKIWQTDQRAERRIHTSYNNKNVMRVSCE